MLQSELVRYILTGLFNTVAGCSMILFFYYVVGLGYMSANAITYTIGLCMSFVFHKRWVFGSDAEAKSEVVTYLAVFGMAFLINLGVLRLSVEALGFHPNIGQILGISAFIVSNYLGHKFITFRKVSKTPDSTGNYQ